MGQVSGVISEAGPNSYGDFEFVVDGNKFRLFANEAALIAQVTQLSGLPVTVATDTRTSKRGTTYEKVISVQGTTGAAVPAAVASAFPTATASTVPASSGGGDRDSRIARQWAVGRAVELAIAMGIPQACQSEQELAARVVELADLLATTAGIRI